MFDNKKIDDVVKQLIDTLPPGIKNLKEELEKNFRAVLQATFAKMNLVTREEFDVQVNVLKRTREKLTVLEKYVAELEKKTNNKQQ